MKFTEEQVEQGKIGLEHGLDAEQIALYYKQNLLPDQMQEIRAGIEAGLSREQVQSYNRPEYSPDQMRTARFCFLRGLNTEQMICCIKAGFDWGQSEEAIRGFEHGLSIDQVTAYYKPEITAVQMQEIRTGIEQEVFQTVHKFEEEVGVPMYMRLTAMEQRDNLYYSQLEKRFQLAKEYAAKPGDEDMDYSISCMETKVAENGGVWTHYRDLSGGFEIDGKDVAQYDMATREIKMNGEWIGFGYEFGGINFIKEYVSNQLAYQQELAEDMFANAQMTQVSKLSR